MRIIGGSHKGRVLKVPQGLPVRPTTDFAKEALFNILTNKIDFERVNILDLFSGTGHISFEFASRGAMETVSVDGNFKCIGFQKSICQALQLKVNPIKQDVFDFLNKTTYRFDVVFADPPYDLDKIPQIHSLVFENGIMKENGLLIIEHGHKTVLNELRGFKERRKYGNVNFSFFENRVE